MEELNDLPPVEKARALLERGHAARREGRDEVAHGYYTQSLNLFRGHRERQGIADALVRLADLALHYNPTGESPFARRHALGEEALAIYREIGDRSGAASALRVLASIAPHAEGAQMLEESLALCREVGDEAGIAASMDRLGTQQAFQDRGKAATLKEEALARYRAIGNRDREATTLFSLAITYMGSDPERSRACAQEALGIYRELGRRKQVAQMLQFLAPREQDDEKQIAYHTESREICRESGVAIWEASSLRSLAEIAEKRGETARAQALRAEADAIYPEEPLDPELLDAFEQALRKEDPDVARDAARDLFLRWWR
jgi:hypothetical protein